MYYTLTSFSHKFKQHSINHFLCEITVIIIAIVVVIIIITSCTCNADTLSETNVRIQQ